MFATIYSELEVDYKPIDYSKACHTIYKCELELKHSMAQLYEPSISLPHESSNKVRPANLPWTSEQYQRYCLDTNYLPTLLKMIKLESIELQPTMEDSQTRLDFLRASVVEHLLSNQLYNIGLENIRRINSQEVSPASAENMLFSLSLLESKSYRDFHFRRRFLRRKLKLLDKHLKAYVVQTYSTLNDNATKLSFFLHYIKQGFLFLLKNLESRVVDEHSMIVENFDILKLYSGKCKAHPYLLFATAIKVVYAGWSNFGLKVPGLVKCPVCSPWCLVYQDVYFSYEYGTLTSRKLEADLGYWLNNHHLISYLFQLFHFYRKVTGRKKTDFAKILYIRSFEDYCTDLNFLTKVDFPHEGLDFDFDFDQFVEHLEKEDALVHKVVFEQAIGVTDIEEVDNNILLPLRGHVIKTRYNKPVVILNTDGLFYNVLTVSGTFETIKSDCVRIWQFTNIQEVNAFIRMIGLNLLFNVDFQYVDINLEKGRIVFG